MIGKILKFPFWLLLKAAGTVSGIVKLLLGLVFGIFRFAFSHVFGTIVGALAGFLLGRKHVGVKLFSSRKKRKNTAGN